MGRAPLEDAHLGRWLRTQRERRGWSIAYVVRRVQSCTAQMLSMVELGQRRPSLTLLTRLCACYGVTTEEFIKEVEEQYDILTPAERDRYTLFQMLCELEDDQRQQVHKTLAPLVTAARRRKALRQQRTTTAESRSAHIDAPEMSQ